MPRGLVCAALASLLVSGCGGKASSSPEIFGTGRDQVWVFRPPDRPRAVVVFLHGFGGQIEQTPANHRAWIDHLTTLGDAVVYPRYETVGNPAPAPTIERAVRRALRRLDAHVPLVVIGYSRGGRLAPDYAALADASPKAAHPAAVIAVFPGPISEQERSIDLRTLDHRTRVLVLVGDHDRTVGNIGARELLARLATAGFPAARVTARLVHSQGAFVATHFSPLENSPAAQAAFWEPADRIVHEAVLSAR